MSTANASNVAGCNAQRFAAALAMTKWLRLAAAPTFLIMALLTVVVDRGMPNALCPVVGDSNLSGMPPMYLLMAAFHSAPWLKLISRQRFFVE